MKVSWAVEIGDEFKPEFFSLQEDVQTEILAIREYEGASVQRGRW